MRACIQNVCRELILSEEELNQLDRGSGDGDCGSTLKSGAEGTPLEGRNERGREISFLFSDFKKFKRDPMGQSLAGADVSV